ncbi:hypothetical protein KP509_27G027500 [Ceratopteris richardii]|uniref:Uncharacterized protein n=1 Tax=Ceratopteris richardii TaxID=49495 RepID=A0A8T2RHF0_CERRI|nr:hypothetical protein KP509_27G027500 [Ceratopteris richardii]
MQGCETKPYPLFCGTGRLLFNMQGCETKLYPLFCGTGRQVLMLPDETVTFCKNNILAS